MKSAWIVRDAQSAVDHYAKSGSAADLALRVYSTRLLGRDPKLVLHGGGNTSVKMTARELTGAPVPALHIKGSGWDMGAIEPAGMPAVRLEPLLTMRRARRLPTTTWRACCARLCSIAGALAFSRNFAARFRAGDFRRSHARHRGALADRPAERG